LINGMNEQIDKRTSGFKRRLEALEPAPKLVTSMVKRALDAGISASYVLMDTWFTHEPLILSLKKLGIDVIGMVNDRKQGYRMQGKRYTLTQLFSGATPERKNNKGILRSAYVEL